MIMMKSSTKALLLFVYAATTFSIADGKCETCDERALARGFVTAAGRGQLAVLARLLAHGVEINDYDASTKRTALLEGARWGHGGVVEMALERGADAHWRDAYGMEACHHAAAMGHTFILETLIAFMEDTEADEGGGGLCVHARDDEAKTPLHHAAARGHAAVAGQLLALGADPGAVDSGGSTARQAATGWFYNHDAVLEVLGGHEDPHDMQLL